MSKLETPMTRRYWAQVGRTLVEEFLMVRGAPDVGRRLADGVIILGGEHRRMTSSEVSLEGKDVIVVQTKANRLGDVLLGQALFSKFLIAEFFNPRLVRTVALRSKDDAVLHPFADLYGIEIVVDDTIPAVAAIDTELD